MKLVNLFIASVFILVQSGNVVADEKAKNIVELVATTPPTELSLIITHDRKVEIDIFDQETDKAFALQISFSDPRKKTPEQKHWLKPNHTTYLLASNEVSSLKVSGYLFDSGNWRVLPLITTEQIEDTNTWNYRLEFYDAQNERKARVSIKQHLTKPGS